MGHKGQYSTVTLVLGWEVLNKIMEHFNEKQTQQMFKK
jgi:hypothetical protein